MRKNEKGFTLLEMLMVLSIWSVLILLSFPLINTSIENHQEKQFLKTFQHDVLYTQNLSYGSEQFIRIIFTDMDYQILYGTGGKVLVKRKIPDGWSIYAERPFNQISFTSNGTIQQSGSIIIRANNQQYHVIFPPGKGRGYIEKM